MSETKGKDSSRRRKFIRLDTVFPVEFCFINKENKGTLSEWMQGYTNNFSKGGICLEAHNISLQTLFLLQSQGASLNIRITVPFSQRSTEAEVAIRWFQESASQKGTYIIGVEYEKIDAAALGTIMRYVYKKKVIFPFVSGLVIISGLLALLLSYRGMQLSKGKSELQQQAAEISQQLYAVREQFQQIVEERKELAKALLALRKEFSSAKEEKSEMAKIIVVQEEWLKKMDMTLKELQDEKDNLSAQLSALQDDAVAEGVSADIQASEEKIEAVRRWLKSRQDPESEFITGSMSLQSEGAGGAVFLSDQADVLQTFVLFSEFEAADKLLGAIKGKLKQKRGLFYDAYRMPGEKPLLGNANSLSNMYLGIAIMQYTQSSGDYKYFSLVEDIAKELASWQKGDPKGAIPFSDKKTDTFLQVNLTAYTFFDMLHSIADDSKYLAARDKTSEYVFSTLPQEIINNPFGESAFLTFGPETLDAAGIDPIAAHDLIESKAFVQGHLTNYDGEDRIFSGISFIFEQGPAQPISSYQTAKMALICGILSGYCADQQMPERAEEYKNKRRLYLKTLSDMIIVYMDDSGIEAGYLPDFFSPDFYSREAAVYDIANLASISAGAYTVFAYYSYNPFGPAAKPGIDKSD